ncbi:TPA: DUF1090 domain-containing protein [Escherichia coli]|uniref:Periplasmic protein n=1 Tax=Proteus hauseri ATCC 700826 TaxID=1354271 RepID=A0AAJ3HVA3_PROHU|nr:DUF1090 domain-containing protein [Proteus hauseri]OAT51226.1 periplasmic protein [Proteus hauseri ATCC 700826]HCH49266.1 DUF1090 domain-containing protein [Proteus sp. (in: enterobacteria)]HDH9217744.1 DUF1090 domain-containing protein [Escherichia coli]
MRKIFFAVIAFSMVASNAYANTSVNGCEIKKQNIQRQIEYAKAHGNQYRLQGLERALQNVERYCTPEKVVENTRLELREKQLDVKERELELQEAQLKGDADKIAKRENKLAEAKIELKELENELNLLTK